MNSETKFHLRRRRIKFIAIMLLIAMAGCSSTDVIRVPWVDSQSADISIDQFNQDVHDRLLIIRLKDKQEYWAVDVTLDPDSARFTDTRTKEKMALPTRSIESFEWKNRIRGAINGLCYTLLPGAILILASMYSETANSYPNFTVVPGSAVMVTGMIVFGALGFPERYEVPADTAHKSPLP